MGLFTKREARTHPSNPAKWLLYGLAAGTETTSGVTVNEEQAMRLASVFACVKVLAESVGSLPLILYKRLGNGNGADKERAVGHPKYHLLHDAPNPEMTSMIWREVGMNHLNTYGNHYTLKVGGAEGQIAELWPFKPANMTVKRIGKDLVYAYRKDGGGTDYYTRREVLHIPGLGYDGVAGYSPIAKARESIGLAFAQESCGAKLFKSGLRPSGVVTHPEQLGPKAHENITKSIKKMVGGLLNMHETLVLEEGMKWQQTSIPPEDAQFLASRKFQIAEIARIFRVPMHMLQELDRATFSNIEQQSLEFVIYTLRPWLVRIEQCYNMQILTESERKQGYFYEHLVDGLLRGDIESRYRAYATGRMNGWLSGNDIRRMENMNSMGKEGDLYLVPLNTQPASWLTAQPPQPQVSGLEQAGIINGEWEEVRQIPYWTTRSVDARNKLAEQFRNLFLAAADRIVTKDAKALQRAVEKAWGQRLDPRQAFDLWLDDFYLAMGKHARDIVSPVSVAYAEGIFAEVSSEIGLDMAFGDAIMAHLDGYLETFAARYVSASRGQIITLLKEIPPDEIAQALIDRANGWLDTRAAKIADDEVIRLGNAVALETYVQGGVRRKRWKTQPGACPFCRAIEKRPPVQINATFAGEGDEIEGQDKGAAVFMGVTGPKLHPPLHRGCKCSVVPVIGA